MTEKYLGNYTLKRLESEIGAKLHSGSTMTLKSVNLTRNLTPLFVKSADGRPIPCRSSLTRIGSLAPTDPFPGHADPGVFRM